MNETVSLIQADCTVALDVMTESSIDAVVTDPPYEIGFDGKAWDSTGIAFRVSLWAAVRRAMRPGAYVLAFGATRTFHRMAAAMEDAGLELLDCIAWMYGNGFPKHQSRLKPAWEPVIVARRHAPKATKLAIDACRLDGGRYPANVMLDEPAAEQLDLTSPKAKPSRFFYVAKATSDEKDAGLSEAAGFHRREAGVLRRLNDTHPERFNHHPTVKPISLMQHLVRLVVPQSKDATVLDPFMGSGTTGCAAMLERRRFVGIERERDYFAIAEARIRHWKGAAA